jgi:hypothetical protein
MHPSLCSDVDTTEIISCSSSTELIRENANRARAVFQEAHSQHSAKIDIFPSEASVSISIESCKLRQHPLPLRF